MESREVGTRVVAGAWVERCKSGDERIIKELLLSEPGRGRTEKHFKTTHETNATGAGSQKVAIRAARDEVGPRAPSRLILLCVS